MLVLELFILLPYLGASGRVVAIKQANIFQLHGWVKISLEFVHIEVMVMIVRNLD